MLDIYLTNNKYSLYQMILYREKGGNSYRKGSVICITRVQNSILKQVCVIKA